MPAIDFSSVKGLDPVPAGTYNAVVIAATEGTSQNGNPKIDVRWQIEGGEYDGRQLFDTLTFTEKAMWRVKKTLQSMGFPKDFKGEVDPEMLLGTSARLVVTIEQSDGVDENGESYPPRNRVNKILEGGKSVKDLI